MTPIRSTTTTSRSRAVRLLVAGASVAAAALVAASVPVVAGSAGSARADAGTGWVRLAHLSPDTKAVDVRVVPLGSTTPVVELDDVAYGTVSPYSQLPGGVYNVTMVTAGAASTARPVLSSSMEVKPDTAETVAAFGENKKLAVQSFSDDLTAPQAGSARIRLIQASTKVKSVDVATSTGIAIARDASAGSATGYASVPAGPWSLRLTAKGVKDSASVELGGGSVSTLLVLDTSRGLTVRPVLDSAAVNQAPVGGVNTGGGWLATHGTVLHGPDDR